MEQLFARSGELPIVAAESSSHKNFVIVDRDEKRESCSPEGFRVAPRHAHNLRVARLAQVLSKQSPVTASGIDPFSKTLHEIQKPLWVFCFRRDQKQGHELPVELRVDEAVDVIADGNAFSAQQNSSKVIAIHNHPVNI